MTEYDYTKWDNKPREMWVWNDDEKSKQKAFVIFCNKDYPKVPVVALEGNLTMHFKHCAEIEQTRRMTSYELAYWLWEGTQKGEFREYRFTYFEKRKESPISSNYVYDDKLKDKEIAECQIRINGGEWKEPLIEE